MGINYFTAFGFAFIATAAFGILFQAPRKSLPVSGVIGAVGWVVYCYIRKDLAYDSFYAMFFATVALSLLLFRVLSLLCRDSACIAVWRRL